MDIKTYINFLFNFYSTASLFPWVQLVPDDEDEAGFSHQFTMNMPNKLKVYPYHLCTKIKKVCWISQKLSKKNFKAIEDLVNHPHFSDCLLTMQVKSNKCIFLLLNIYGNIIYKTTIKYFSINLF